MTEIKANRSIVINTANDDKQTHPKRKNKKRKKKRISNPNDITKHSWQFGMFILALLTFIFYIVQLLL